MADDVKFYGQDDVQRRLKILEETVSEQSSLIETLETTMSAAISTISQNYVDKTSQQSLTNKRINGLKVYHVSTGSNTKIKITRQDADDSAHVGGIIFMEQNSRSFMAILTVSDIFFIKNTSEWTSSYSAPTYTIDAQAWSTGWFIPFDSNKEWTVTYE